MAYDLKSVKGPRIAGWKLKLVTSLSEKPVSGGAITQRMLADVGVERFRARSASAGTPTAQPLPKVGDTRFGAPEVGDVLRDGLSPRTPEDGYRPLGVQDYANAYRNGETTPVSVAEAILLANDAIEQDDMNLFISQDPEDVMRQAEASAERHRRGEPLGILDGVPVGVKDEVDQSGYGTSVGTRIHGQTKAREDSFSVGRLRSQGALLIGKLNMHELGMGVTGINVHHGTPRNPYNPQHITGGSSSASAAAVGAGLCPLALGADGGGSIRVPASFCGVVGLKPTYGRISEHGAAPLCWSVAHLGPMAFTAADAAIGYAAMAGVDRRDPNTLAQPTVTLAGLEDADCKGLKIGVYDEWFQDADDEVIASCANAIDELVARGAERVPITLYDLDLVRTAHLITIASEMAASQKAVPRGEHHKYGCDTRLLLRVAETLTAVDYINARRHREVLTEQFLDVLQSVDVIATPTTGVTAPVLHADALEAGETNLALVTRIMRFAPAANLTGLPGISVPVGYDQNGLPIGLQFLGRPWDEQRLLGLAHLADSFIARQKPERSYAPTLT
ncbi:MAG: amidase [Myxococcales bacterium]|nr:amidase [Myxococcales bacterium]